MSSIQYFHGFVGFEYKDTLVGFSMPKANLDKLTKCPNIEEEMKIPKNKIYINLGYNAGQDYTYVYVNQHAQFEKEFLTPEAIEMFKPIKRVKVDKKTLYSGKVADENLIVFNYGQDVYTLPFHEGKPVVLDKKETKKFLEGGLPRYISNKFFISFSIQNFNEEITKYLAVPSKDIKLPVSNAIIEICRKVQSQTLDDYVSKVIPKVKSKFPADELLIFELYIKGFRGIFSMEGIIHYIEEYFEEPMET